MPNLTQRLVPPYVGWIIRWRWSVLIACLMAAVAAGSGVRYLEITADFRVYFGKNNPQLIAYETLEDIYTKTDHILFVLQPRDKTSSPVKPWGSSSG